MRNRRKIWGASVVCLVLIAMMTIGTINKGTLALFTDKDEAVNSMTMGKLEGEIIETPTGLEKKNIGYRNSASGIACYVRMLVTIPKAPENSGIIVTAEPNEVDWYQVGEYWYYKDIVGVGDKTSNLYDSVKIDVPDGTKITPEMYDIIVYAETVQADNMNIPDDQKAQAAYYVFNTILNK